MSAPENLAQTFRQSAAAFNPELSIVLPTKDRHPILFKTLASILESTKNIPCEILIIDNSISSDIQLPENLKRHYVFIYKNPGNRNSVFASRNYGCSIATSDCLLFIDDDILVNEASIRFAMEFQKSNPRAASNVSWEYPPVLMEQMRKTFFGRFLIHSGFTTMRELYGVERWKDKSLFESGEVASFFLSVSRKLFLEIGAYEERHLHEGTDISLIENFRKNTIPMFIHAGITVYHNEEDRIEMKNWLGRKKRLGEISAHAVALGEKENHLMNYSSFKSALFRLIYFFRPLLFLFIRISPQRMNFLDKFMFRLISALTGAYIHSGYSSMAGKTKKHSS